MAKDKCKKIDFKKKAKTKCKLYSDLQTFDLLVYNKTFASFAVKISTMILWSKPNLCAPQYDQFCCF